MADSLIFSTLKLCFNRVMLKLAIPSFPKHLPRKPQEFDIIHR